MIHNFLFPILLNHEYQVLLFEPVSISLGYIMDSYQTAYLSKMAESALAAHAKIRPSCTLKHRVQQEYNSLLVNALNRVFKSNLSLNNFWLLTKLELSCVRNIIPRSKSGASKSRPRWAAHTRIGNVWEYPPPPGLRLRFHIGKFDCHSLSKIDCLWLDILEGPVSRLTSLFKQSRVPNCSRTSI